MPPARERLSRAHRRVLQDAIEQNVAPVFTKNKQSTVLVTPGHGRGIVERRGVPTELGRAWYRAKRIRWVPRTHGGVVWDDVTTVHTDPSGMGDYVVHLGKKITVMQWDPVALKQKVTKAGRQFVANSHMNVDVVVPVRARLRQGGRECETEFAWEDATDTREEVRVLRAQSGQD